MNFRPGNGRASRKMSSAARWIIAAAVAGALLAALGPFGSYMNRGPFLRFGYWMAAVVVGLAIYVPALKVATRIAPPGTRARWPVLIAAALIASVPEAWITWAAAFWLWPPLARLGLSALTWYAQTATVGLAATVGTVLLLRLSAASARGEATPAPAVAAPVEPLPGNVIALQMEDHYVRVHTPHGSELILMPLGNAIAALTAEGLQTHRSWWVARDAVTAGEGTPRAMRLHLSNGVVAPVSRSAVARLRTAGWIAA